jgi:hypothetical protein
MVIHPKLLLLKNHSPSSHQSPSRMYDVLSKFSNKEVWRDSDSIYISLSSTVTPHTLRVVNTPSLTPAKKQKDTPAKLEPAT